MIRKKEKITNTNWLSLSHSWAAAGVLLDFLKKSLEEKKDILLHTCIGCDAGTLTHKHT